LCASTPNAPFPGAENPAREYLEGMVALVLMAYGIGLALREAVRERVLGGSGSYRLYSGLFVLLRLKVKVSYGDIPKIVQQSLSLFPRPALSPVSTHV